jgi:hypothetical protein
VSSTAEQVRRIRYARKWQRRRKAVQDMIDGFFVWLFGLFDYELPHNSRWSLFAELFWSDCPICFWYRGVGVTFVLVNLFHLFLWWIL